MKITVFGGGKTGSYLTRVMTMEGHDVTVIEKSGTRCAKLNSLYDISTITSEGIKKEVFNEENFDGCDLFIAVSPIDEMNMMACAAAKKIGAHRTIARVRNEDYTAMEDIVASQMMGIDQIIHPEKELSIELINLIRHPNATDVYELYGGKILIVSTIIKENSKIVDKSLIEINSIYDLSVLRVVVVEKGMKAIIPHGDYVLKAGDKIYAVATRENVHNIFTMAGYREERNNTIMIQGSGKIARTIAGELARIGAFDIKIIIDDEEKAIEFAEDFPQILVVHGEATDIDVLVNEGIMDIDFFLAITESDETNMVTSLLASHLEVHKTVTLIEKTDYFPITKTIGLQRCINSSISTANAVMRFARYGNVLASSTLKGIDVEFTTFKISAQNRCVDKPLPKINFPRNCIIGSIVREGKSFVPTGKTVIRAEDEVVIFSDKSSVQTVGELFAE